MKISMRPLHSAQRVTPEQLRSLRYPPSKSWTKAAGLLRHKRKELERHLKRVGTEWDHPISVSDGV